MYAAIGAVGLHGGTGRFVAFAEVARVQVARLTGFVDERLVGDVPDLVVADLTCVNGFFVPPSQREQHVRCAGVL